MCFPVFLWSSWKYFYDEIKIGKKSDLWKQIFTFPVTDTTRYVTNLFPGHKFYIVLFFINSLKSPVQLFAISLKCREELINFTMHCYSEITLEQKNI